MQDLSLIQQLLPGIPLEAILNPKLPPPVRFPLRAGVTEADLENSLAASGWQGIHEPENNTPPKQVITGAQLALICTRLNIDKAKEISGILNTVLPVYGMDHVDYLEEFIPNLAVESSEFSRMEENLGYSAKRLLEVFPKYYKTLQEAQADQYRPEKIANKVYGGKDGNTEPGDGYFYRGAGPIQFTRKAVFLMYARYKKLEVEKVPELLRHDLQYGIDSACWFFAVYKSLKDEALADKFVKICTSINGGTNGLLERKAYNIRTRKILRG